MKKTILFYCILLSTLFYFSACNGQTTSTASPTIPSPTSTQTEPLKVEATHAVPNLNQTTGTSVPPSPQVLSRLPLADQEANLDTPIELVFDQKMDPNSFQTSFHVKDSSGTDLPGQLTWLTPDHLRFTPEKQLDKAAYYRVILDATAKSSNQQPLNTAFEFQFKTFTPLQVSQVFPDDGVEQVKVDNPLTVIFNRPVVSLGINDDQTKLPQPLKLSPEVKGNGTWINTSTYVFYPSQILASGTQYKAMVSAGLLDASSDPKMALPSDKTWQFTTLKPSLTDFQVDKNELDLTKLDQNKKISLLPNMVLSFSQAMDPNSTAKAFTLLNSNSQAVALSLKWNTDGRMVTVTPAHILNLDSSYTLNLTSDARAGDGGALGQPLKWAFTTIPAPGILSTFPADGSKTETSYNFSIAFKSPMRPDSISSRVKITPALAGKTLDWQYDEKDETASFYGLAPSTTYTVEIAPGMLDVYGNALAATTTVHFTTGSAAAQVYLNMPSQPLFRLGAPQQFFISATNVHTVNISIYKAAPADLSNFRTIDDISLDEKNLINKYDFSPTGKPDQGSLNKVEIKTANGDPLAPGAYFLGIDSQEITHKNHFIDGRFFVVTGTFLVFKDGPDDSLIWAVDPKTGKPVSNLQLQEFSVDDKQNQTPLGSGKTDDNGLLHLEFTNPDRNNHIVASTAGSPFTFASSNWNSEVHLEDFGINNVYNGNEFNTNAYVYSDRPLYRPGQPVYFKGILRTDNDLSYQLPSQKEVEVVINSYNKEVYRKTLPVSNSGTFNDEFLLDNEAALGFYTLTVQKPGTSGKDVISYGSLGFNVAEYKKPEFQIDLKTDPGNILLGKSFKANLNATYYSGGPLINASVSWILRASPFFYSPPETYSSYSFTNPASDAEWFANGSNDNGPREIGHGETVTDANGKVELNIPAVVTFSADSQELNLETNLTDLSGNLVSSQAKVVAHRADFYPGIRSTQYLGKAGEDQSFDVVVLDWDGKPVAKQAVSVTINERQWLNVQKMDAQGVLRWESSVKDIPVTTINQLTDEKGLATVSFKPAKGGTYRAVATVTDKGGRINRSATYVWVAGSDYIPWRQTNDRTFQLITDKTTYKAGDQADLLIASPFQGDAYALVTVERGKVRQQEVLHLTNNSTVYHLPVTDDMGPAVYISVTVVKGIDKNNPTPTYKTGMTRINVSSEKKILQVSVTPDKAAAGPGDKVEFTVKTSDVDGKPVAAEVSLGLSDLASLSLTDPNSVPIDQFFYGLRGLMVQTMLSYSANIEEYNARLNQMASEGAGSGGSGKGGDVMGVMDVRQDFKDTAFWNAIIQTDAGGQATVSVTLPDNLTTWRMDARAVTNDTLVGQTKADIISSKLLLVRPQTPRFFIAGDQSQVGTAIHNNTGKDQTVTASLKADGVQLQDPAEQKVEIPAGQQAMLTWKVTVPMTSNRVDLVFSATGGAYSDASTPPLGTLDHQGIPVYSYQAPETVGTSGEVGPSETRTEAIHLPDKANGTPGNLKVELEPSLAAGLTGGFDFLNTYPYETTEVDISRFLPNITLLKALKSATQADQTQVTKLENEVNTGIQRIYSRQNNDGGWGWWNGLDSDPLTSAYVMYGLAAAQDYGLKLDADVVENGKNYLQKQINMDDSDKSLPLMAQYNRQSFILYVLALHSNYQTNITDKLFTDRNALSLYAKAFLAQTIWKENNSDDRLNTLRSELAQAALISASGVKWEEKSPDPWNWNTDTRTTAIVLNAIITIDPKSELASNGVRWLMHNRRNGCWFTTQENAWALITLAKWLQISGELNGNYAYAVALNGKTLTQGQVNSSNLNQVQTLNVDIADLLKDQSNQLVLGRSDGDGRLYYSTFMTLSLPADQVKPLDQGMSLTKRYYRPDDLKTPITQANNGEILETELLITVPNSLHYVMITDPLPAGMEAIDSSLKTSPQPTIPDGFDWSKMGSEGWGWWFFNHFEQRDEKVVLFADYLPAGTYVYHYRVRATTPGQYQVIPTTGQEVYFPDVYGRGAGSVFSIK